MMQFFRRLYLRLTTGSPVPWLDIPPFDPWNSTSHGEHRFEAVSRHSIAETGLVCPRCQTEAARRADYSLVCRSIAGEVIQCRGVKKLPDGTEGPCLAYLVASPDTEHGDDKVWDKTPADQRPAKFFTFRRITRKDAIKEQHGTDVVPGEFGEVKADAALALPLVSTSRCRREYKVGDTFHLNNGWIAQVISVQLDNDPKYHGWAKVIFQNQPAFEWHLDPFGTVKRDMRDPTLNDLHISTDQRPI